MPCRRWARCGLAGALALISGCAVPGGAVSPAPPELEALTTVEQVGPVAYRDPVGRVSPDGQWLAVVERGRIRIGPAAGGAVKSLGPGAAQIRYLTWFPDSRRVLVEERVFDRSRDEWWVHDRSDGSRRPLWPDRGDAEPRTGALDTLAWSADGARIAGVTRGEEGATVWVLDADGGGAEARARGGQRSFPAWTPDGRLACLAWTGDRQHLHLPCEADEPLFSDHEVWGPFAFASDGERVFYAAPVAEGDQPRFLEVHSRPVAGGRSTPLTSFARDAYAPSVGADGAVVFRSQDYRVFLATAPAEGGDSTPLTAFQSETPTWSPDGERIGFTFGSWRHVTDDFHYPDIAQHLGTVGTAVEAPHAAPQRIVRQSYSEDQGMHWSPNGRWLIFHTHEGGDDIWLMPADGGEARPISRDGHETGWARWSPDGRYVVYTSYLRNAAGARSGRLFTIGLDQQTGEITEPQREVPLEGFELDVIQAEWSDGGETLVFEAAEAVGRKSLWTVPRTGGVPTRFHDYGSDQIHSGIGVSPDGAHALYVDRGEGGFFQIFRVPVGGGEAVPVTSDPTHKTQPAWSPLGDRIAFTVFHYRSHFWRIQPAPAME